MPFKNKKGISVIIGYIILVTATLAISVIVFAWLRSYIPTESTECPDGISLFIEDTTSCTSNQLNLIIKNNGRFDIGGYFIHASTDENAEIAAENLADDYDDTQGSGGGSSTGQAILFVPTNSLTVSGGGSTRTDIFDLSTTTQIYFLELIPARYVEVDGKERLASCGNAKIKYEVSCS